MQNRMRKSLLGGQVERHFENHAAARRILRIDEQTSDRSKKAAAEILRRLCPKRERPVYFVTRSSHLTMASMANIEMAQTMTNTPHVIQIGIVS